MDLQPGARSGTAAREIQYMDAPRVGSRSGVGLKEALRRLWHYLYLASGWKFLKRWYFWATHSRLQPIRKAVETIRRHIENIPTYYPISIW